ncbi:glycosyltransferase, partial [Candidatus Calescamantes bacterium]|nr:glycosyltransferase [Candidatus Calescamantes bacterium]
MKLRVLHILSSLDGGGVETMLKRLIVNSRGRFDHGILIINKKGRHWDDLASLDIWMQDVFRRGKFDLFLPAKIARKCTLFKPDIIQGYALVGNMWARIGNLFNNYPLITYERGTAAVHGKLLNALDRLLSFREKIRLCNSETSEILTHERVKINNTKVIRNFIDIPRTDISELKARIPTFVWTGRLEWKRGAHLLPALAACLKELLGDYKLIVLGDGSLRCTIESEIKAAEVASYVNFLGNVDEPWEYYSEAHAGIFLNLTESFGNGAAEMLALGLPIAAPRCDNYIELVRDGSNGILYAKTTESSFRFWNVINSRVVPGGDPDVDAAAAALKRLFEDNISFQKAAKDLKPDYFRLSPLRYSAELETIY